MIRRNIALILILITAVIATAVAFRQARNTDRELNPAADTEKTQPKVEVREEPSEEEPAKLPSKSRTVGLYFSDSSEEYLIREERVLPAGDATPAGLVKELVKGPHRKGLQSTLPPGTQALSVSREWDLIIADFNSELQANIGGGSTSEIMAVYSIVATLTEFTGAKQVRFLIEGKPIDTLNGHLDLSEPVEPDPNLVK